jgi:uncharacterized membrane protein
LAARFRNYLFAGILITAPISITLYVTWSIVTWVDDVVARVLPAHYNPSTYMPFGLPGLGLVMLVVALTVIGFLTANFLGRSLLAIGEPILGRMPFIRSVYSAIKQIFETVLQDKSTAFREVVLLEFPRSGAWTLGLVIGRTEGEIRDKLPEDLMTVFVPTAPNPTSGYVLFVPHADAIRLEMSVEDALKMIVSGGLVTPPRKG